MKKSFFPILTLLAVVLFASCNKYETYADKKAKEREAIDRFIIREGINVIDEETFNARGQKTNVAENEYVRLNRSGVYMQIVREGCGTMLEENKVVNVLCRFSEYNILADSMLVCNNREYYMYNQSLGIINCMEHVDKMSVTRTGTTINATFIEGMMMIYHSSSASVPAGWLVPLNYVSIGRPENETENIARVKLIVPHSQGTADAASSVYPCYYELTYVREK